MDKSLACWPSAMDLRISGLTFGSGVLLLAALWFQPYVPIEYLMKDHFTVVGLTDECCRSYYGLVTNLGVLLWSATAAICLFGSLLLFAIDRRRSDVVFLAAAGSFTGWLALDDFFMIHEDVLPWFGVPELATYAIYAAAAVGYVLCSWRRILAFRPVLMAAALALLGMSVATDVLVHSGGPIRLFLEDGSKFLGILAWTGFHLTATFELLVAAVAQPRFVLVSRAPR